MTIASGVSGQVRVKKETTLGTLAGTSGGSILRRRSCDLDISKDTYESPEIVTHFQVGDFRHGLQRGQGTLVADFSPGSHSMLMQSALRRDFAAVTAIASLSITIAGSGPTYTVTRSAGDFLAGGIKRGMIVKLTAGTFNAANLNKNLFVLSATATVLTVVPLNGVALVAEGPIASATLSVPGKVTYTPTTGHTSDAFTVERWFPDIAQSRVYAGNRVASMGLSLQPNGIADISYGFLGQRLANRGTSAYFTSPTAASSTGSLAAVQGKLARDGTLLANVTGINIALDNGLTVGPVVGSDYSPDVFYGRTRVTGQLTAYLEDATLLDAFADETPMTLAVVAATGTEAAADFVAMVLQRIKLGGASVDDGEKGLIVTAPFTALYNSAGGSGTQTEQTTLWVQDSQAA